MCLVTTSWHSDSPLMRVASLHLLENLKNYAIIVTKVDTMRPHAFNFMATLSDGGTVHVVDVDLDALEWQ